MVAGSGVQGVEPVSRGRRPEWPQTLRPGGFAASVDTAVPARPGGRYRSGVSMRASPDDRRLHAPKDRTIPACGTTSAWVIFIGPGVPRVVTVMGQDREAPCFAVTAVARRDGRNVASAGRSRPGSAGACSAGRHPQVALTT